MLFLRANFSPLRPFSPLIPLVLPSPNPAQHSRGQNKNPANPPQERRVTILLCPPPLSNRNKNSTAAQAAGKVSEPTNATSFPPAVPTFPTSNAQNAASSFLSRSRAIIRPSNRAPLKPSPSSGSTGAAGKSISRRRRRTAGRFPERTSRRQAKNL